MRNDYVLRQVTHSYLAVSILSVLATTLGMMVDSVVIGRFLGSGALAAANIASPVFYIYAILAGILATGGTARGAQYVGKDQPDEVNNVFTIIVLVTVVVSVILTGAGVLFHDAIAAFLGASPELLVMTSDYVLGMSFAALPVNLTLVLMSFTRMDNSRNLALQAIVIMTIVNAILDLAVVLIFHGGMLGMALATAISYALAALVCGTHFFRKHNTLRLVSPRQIRSELLSASVIGFPEAASRLYSTTRTFLLNHLLIVLGGVVAVTAFSVRSNAYYLVGAVTLGAGQAIVPVVSVFFGEEDRTAVRDALVNTLRTGMILNVTAAAALFLLAGPFTGLYGVTRADFLETSRYAVELFAISMPVMFINITLMSFYQCTRNFFLANVISAGRSLVLVIGLAFLLARIMGVNGVWVAFILTEIVMLAIVVALVRKKAGKWPRTAGDFMLLPDGFGGKPEDTFDLSIGNSMDEVVEVSKRIGAFCEARGLDARRTYLTSLAVEEMAGNVVTHGFKPGEKKFFDIRVLIKGESLILRVRDDGPRFHPFEYLASQDPSDLTSNIGLRMVKAMASSVDYRYSVGLNNTVVRL